MSEPTEREWLEGLGERFEREHEERVMSEAIRRLWHLVRYWHWPRYGMDLTGTGVCNLCWDLTDQ